MSKKSLSLEGIVTKAESYGTLQRFRLIDVELPSAILPSGKKQQSWLLVNGPRTVNNGDYVTLKTERTVPYEDIGGRSRSGFYLNVAVMKVYDRIDGKMALSYHQKIIFDGPIAGDVFGKEE
jgi:hypothetical protein